MAIQGSLLPITPLSHDSVEHFSPPEIVDPARELFGGFDLDPFSCRLANTIVRAERYYSLAERREDGFLLDWRGRVIVNPPGGKTGTGESSQAVAWYKAMMERDAGRVSSGLYVCFNLSFLQTSQQRPRGLPVPLDFPICYPSDRIDYLVDHLPGPTPKQPKRKPTKQQIEDFNNTGLCRGGAPTNATCLVLIPPRDELGARRMAAAFRAKYETLGKVVIPR